MQRLFWVGVAGNSGGTAARQASTAIGQRGAKEQPAGNIASDGTFPAIVGSGVPAARNAEAWPSFGTERIKPAV